MSAAHPRRIFSPLPDDPVLRRALVACAPALELTDESALKAIRLAIGTKQSSEELLWQLKESGWVWVRPGGTWKLLDRTRAEGLALLEQEVGTGVAAEIESVLIHAALERAKDTGRKSAVAAYARRRAIVEAAYLRLRSGLQLREATADLLVLWLEETESGKIALARAVDRLVKDVAQYEFSPIVQFFRGIAAEARGDRDRAVQLLSASAAGGRDNQEDERPTAAVALFEHARLVAHDDPVTARKDLALSLELWPDRAHRKRVGHLTRELFE